MEVNSGLPGVADLQVVTPQTEPGGVGDVALETVSTVHDPQPAGQSDYEIARPLSRQPIIHQTIDFLVGSGPPASGIFGPQMLGFLAKSFRYDNATGYWIFFTDPGMYIAPWALGGVVNLPSGLLTIRFEFGVTVRPPNSPNPVATPPTTGQRAIFTFYSKHQPPCPPGSVTLAAG